MKYELNVSKSLELENSTGLLSFFQKTVNIKGCLVSFMHTSLCRTFCIEFLYHDTFSVYFHCLYRSLPSETTSASLKHFKTAHSSKEKEQSDTT